MILLKRPLIFFNIFNNRPKEKMFLKCSHCIYQRILTGTSSLKRFRILSSCYYSTNSEKNQESRTSRQDDKESFLKAIKDRKGMTINTVPKKESLNTLLKVQQVSQEIPQGFKTVYQFPFVKYCGLVNRAKVYQTAVSLVACVASVSLWACGIIPVDYIYTCFTVGVSGCLMFYSLGYAAAYFVGFIYYNEEKHTVRIAYVDFWGRRRDIEVPVSDIMPRAESPIGLINKVWFPLKRYSTNDVLKLQLEQGLIVDPEALKKIL